MSSMADQWNLVAGIEWAIVIGLSIYHVGLFFSPPFLPRLWRLTLLIPALGLIVLLILSLVRPSLRWPIYPALVLTLGDLAWIIATLGRRPTSPRGIAAILRALGCTALLLLALFSLGLVAVFPTPPERTDLQVAVTRFEGWLRLARYPGGRPLRWRPGQVPVLEDYLTQWTVAAMDPAIPVETPAILAVAPHSAWDYRLLLEDLANSGFQVWIHEGQTAATAEEPGWGPPVSWNWLRWPEFLSKLSADVLTRWDSPPATAQVFQSKITEAARWAARRGLRWSAVLILGQWEDLSRIRLPPETRALVCWGHSRLPAAPPLATLVVSPEWGPKPASALAYLGAEGLRPLDLSDHAVLRPWLGLPHLGRLGPNASLRYASAREVTVRFFQAELWGGERSLFRAPRVELPGGMVLLGSP